MKLLLTLIGLVASLGGTPADEAASEAGARSARPPRPQRVVPARLPGSNFLVAAVRDANAIVALRSAPAGPIVEIVGGRTEFGSRLSLSIGRKRGDWLGVTSPSVPNGRVAWVDASATRFRFTEAELVLNVDLGRRELYVREGRALLRRIPVAIGAPGSPTPTGRFAVTDKLPGARYGAMYGCCILALSGHQPRAPAGWRAGNRLAIHGGSESAIGASVSAGCLRASEVDLRYLLRTVPVGTPVFIYD